MPPILPGATIGILGGGQLGRMLTLSARVLGYHVHVLDPDPRCAAAPVADRVVAAPFSDAAAAAELASRCDVVTVEIEKIAPASMAAAAAHAPVRPGGHVLEVIQDRARQKQWLASHGFPVGPFRAASTPDELAEALAAFPGERFVKSAVGGYDGRGQARLRDEGATPADLWASLGAGTCVVEEGLDLEAELSVMVARRPGGETMVFPPALNHHERQILAWSVLPAPLPPAVLEQATAIARGIAERLDVTGLLAVELFLVRDGRLLVNELAPRPHNSFHHTELACVTSQFEQGVRAACDLPLGAVEVLRPAAIVNLFGDLWLAHEQPRFDLALALPGVRLHLYGKRGAKPGRKMGHLTAVGRTAEDALALARAAAERLGG